MFFGSQGIPEPTFEEGIEEDTEPEKMSMTTQQEQD